MQACTYYENLALTTSPAAEAGDDDDDARTTSVQQTLRDVASGTSRTCHGHNNIDNKSVSK